MSEGQGSSTDPYFEDEDFDSEAEDAELTKQLIEEFQDLTKLSTLPYEIKYEILSLMRDDFRKERNEILTKIENLERKEEETQRPRMEDTWQDYFNNIREAEKFRIEQAREYSQLLQLNRKLFDLYMIRKGITD